MIRIAILVLLIFLNAITASAWSDKGTHQEITAFSIQLNSPKCNLKDYLISNLGLSDGILTEYQVGENNTKTIKALLMDGSAIEDLGIRRP